jgi:VanZ family protein
MHARDPSQPPSNVPAPFRGGERRRRRLSVRWLVFAAGLAAAITFITVCPIDWRPRLSVDPDRERLVAFALLGFATKLALPRRHGSLLAALVILIAGLELSQMFVPGRDARVGDALVKMLGAAVGLQVGLISLVARRMLGRRPGVAAEAGKA